MFVNKAKEKPKTIKLPMMLSLILSISAIIVILYFTFDAEDFGKLASQQIKYEFFIAAIGVNVLYWIMWGMRQKVLSTAVDPNVKISLVKSTKIIIANLFLASITPSMAGGEPVRIHLLNKNGLSLGGATASVLSGRLLDAVFLLICVPIAFWIFGNNIGEGYLKAGLTVAICVFLAGVAIFVYAIKNPKKMKSFLIWLSDKLSRFSKKKEGHRKVVKKINHEVDNFHNSMVFFLTKGKIAFLKAGILTAVFWITGWMIPPLILMGLGLPPFIIESCAAQVLLIIIVMMPTTPGGAFVTEGGVAALYSVIIPEAATLGVFVILFRFITYHMGLITGAIFQYRIFKSVASFSMDVVKKRE